MSEVTKLVSLKAKYIGANAAIEQRGTETFFQKV